jgi:hypothetical protein
VPAAPKPRMTKPPAGSSRCAPAARAVRRSSRVPRRLRSAAMPRRSRSERSGTREFHRKRRRKARLLVPVASIVRLSASPRERTGRSSLLPVTVTSRLNPARTLQRRGLNIVSAGGNHQQGLSNLRRSRGRPLLRGPRADRACQCSFGVFRKDDVERGEPPRARGGSIDLPRPSPGEVRRNMLTKASAGMSRAAPLRQRHR